MKIFLRRILDRVFVVLGAFLFCQFPLFIHHYEQQLIGHVEELRFQVDLMHETALRSGKNVNQYVQKFIDHEDQDFSDQGKSMKRMLARFDKLSTALMKLQNASLLSRPVLFLVYVQWDIFKSTVKTFEPGIPFTTEGVYYALLGMVTGFAFFYVLASSCKRIVRVKSSF